MALQDHIENERWDKVLELISMDNSLCEQIDPRDISYKIFYYSLQKNLKEDQNSSNFDLDIFEQVVYICIQNGLLGNTLPQATAFQNKERIISLLQDGHDINQEDFGERTAIMVAATLNDYALSKFLIEQSCNVSHYDQDSFEAIDFTTSNEIFDLLHLHKGRTKEERKKAFDEYCEAKEYWNDINKK